MALKPLNDNVLVELIEDNSGLSLGTDATDSIQKGVVVSQPHLAYISGGSWVIPFKDTESTEGLLNGCTVYWRQYSEKEATFEVDGKKLALIRFSDLVAAEVE